MTHKYEHLLPPEFKSGNDIPVTRAIISVSRMEEIIQEILDYKMDRTEDEVQMEMLRSDANHFRILAECGAFVPNPFLPSAASSPWGMNLSGAKASIEDLRKAVDVYQKLQNTAE